MDFYAEGGYFRVGELTNCPMGGNLAFPDEASHLEASKTLLDLTSGH